MKLSGNVTMAHITAYSYHVNKNLFVSVDSLCVSWFFLSTSYSLGSALSPDANEDSLKPFHSFLGKCIIVLNISFYYHFYKVASKVKKYYNFSIQYCKNGIQHSVYWLFLILLPFLYRNYFIFIYIVIRIW